MTIIQIGNDYENILTFLSNTILPYISGIINNIESKYWNKNA